MKNDDYNYPENSLAVLPNISDSLVPKNEVLLSANNREIIDNAMAYAIANGAQVDIEQEINSEFTPNLVIGFTRRGISISAGFSFKRQKNKKYRMKD